LHFFEYPFEASKPCILPSTDEELIADFVQAMSNLISRYRKTINPDSRQHHREVENLTNCFTKHIATRAEAMASQSPLLVEKQAYNEPAGHAPQLP
jgi:hypothetical protein